MTPFFYTFREREVILDLFEEYCGARLTLNCMRPGGQPFDLPSAGLERCRAFIDTFPGEGRRVRGAADEEPDLEEADGRGRHSPAGGGLDYGVTGPMLRASGVDWDLRKAMPYEAYGEVDFDVPGLHNCDTYDRYLVRMEEMRQSVRIVRQCLDKLPTVRSWPRSRVC